MSKLELKRCDACGLISGEDGRSTEQWALIYVPEEHFVGVGAGRLLARQLHYCFNCWIVLRQYLPTLPDRPTNPPVDGWLHPVYRRESKEKKTK